MAKVPKPHKEEDYELCDYPNHPGQQHASGWAPRELARVVGAKVVSITPDVCLTPVGNSVVPIPYSITAVLTDDAKSTKSVRIDGKQAYNMGTDVTCCKGDAPGSKKGVKSGTIEAKCEPKTHAPTVKIEGKHAIRNGDIFWMNNRNTIGELILTYSTDLHWT
ncbi:MAG: DUF4150 domain-containing protein [Pseudomonadota bacterium]